MKAQKIVEDRNLIEEYVIYTGETEQFRELEDAWMEEVVNSGRCISEEYALERTAVGQLPDLNDLAREIRKHECSKQRAVIYFLMKYYEETFSEEDRERLFQHISEGKIGVRPDKKCEDEAVRRSESQFSYLVERVQETFQANGMPKDHIKPGYIRKMILCFDEHYLLDAMALGLGMSVEHVNVFLCKILKRDSLDAYDYREFILDIVLKHKTHMLSLYEEYHQILKYYENIKMEGSEDAEYGRMLTSEARKVHREERNLDEMAGGTLVYLKERESVLQKTQDWPLFDDKDCTEENINWELNQILREHKARELPKVRTPEEEFQKLLNEVMRKYDGQILRELSFMKAPEGEISLKALRREGAGYLSIQYDGSRKKKIVLPKGFRFYRLRDKKKEDKKENRVYYELTEECTLPRKERVEEAILVKSITERPEDGGRKSTFLNEKIMQNEKGTLMAEGKLSAKIFQARPESGVSFYKREKEGKLKITCPWGLQIPEGTKFTYHCPDGDYEFETAKTVQIPKHAEHEVKIKACDTSEFERQRDGYVMLASGDSITGWEEEIEGIFKVTNLKPVNYQSEDKAKEGRRVSFSGFCQFLYEMPLDLEEDEQGTHTRIQVEAGLFDDWFRSTKISYDSVKKFDSKSVEVQRAYLLTLLFLKFALDSKIEDGAEMYDVREEFEEEVDVLMNRCRFQRLYLGNAYDFLLVYLLASEEPVYLLRTIWGTITLAEKEKGGVK